MTNIVKKSTGCEKVLALQKPVLILKKQFRILIPDKFRKSHQILHDLLKSFKAKYNKKVAGWAVSFPHLSDLGLIRVNKI